ncbi:hypothetical protein F4560_008111 [Saccharothrix ecbatanensis]|uniref:Uncharacterized protein n=1 Tax=Saccharothrix ecbatanensis TaxID=1105145 RepID=A0A7W9HUT1_9PSEU|nr:hypothetical protein [Saccharothrix ecbatanensis]MBB5808343.1 hypothetical protein [Saccharothrix ecbatanensis]
MGDEMTRPPGRRWPWRRPSREPVHVGRELPYEDGWDDEPGDGSAGVREPRHPRPLGPTSGAGERPIPDEPIAVKESQCLIERT